MLLIFILFSATSSERKADVKSGLDSISLAIFTGRLGPFFFKIEIIFSFIIDVS
jgi:hypothetical protein